MKTRNFWCFMLMSMITLMGLYGLVACDPEREPDPPMPEISIGSLESSIQGGGGTGNSSSPYVVTQGDTLGVTMSRKCSYTDPNGSIHACAPKATINVYTHNLGEIHAKDLQTLLAVTEYPIQTAQRTTQSGSYPVVEHSALQTFDVGGQKITFDLMYQIFSYINSRHAKIEMPYIKLNPAKYGAAQTRGAMRSAPAVSVRGIQLRPHRAPMFATITNSECYDVVVSFNLDIESGNTEDPEAQTLSFEVSFVAVVETTTEVPDPTTSISYELNVVSGTQSVSSPFEKKKGEDLRLQLLGSTGYSYFSMEDMESRTVTYDLTANISLKALKDALEITDAATLKNVSVENSDVTVSDSNPKLYKDRQIIKLGGGQVLTLDWDYQSYDDVQIQGESMALPYLKLEDPQVLDVSVNETTGGGLGGTYEVTVRIRQNVKVMNSPESKTETLEYVVKYTANKEVKLVKVTYRKDWEWIEAHDNLPLLSYAIVYRDRTYSDGQTYTDTFRDYGKPTQWTAKITPFWNGDTVEVTWDGGKIIYYPYHLTERTSETVIAQTSLAIPDFDHFQDFGFTEDEYTRDSPGTWSAYEPKKLYTNLDLDLSGVTVVGQGLPSSLESGWYSYYSRYVHDVVALRYYPGFNIPGNYPACPILEGYIYDQFLVIDGMMFTFNEFIEPFEFNEKVENFPGDANRGPGKIYTTEVHSRILGKNFYAAAIDTVYTILR